MKDLTMNRRTAQCATLITLLASSVPARAAPPDSAPGLSLTGRLAHPHTVSAAELRAMPMVTIQAGPRQMQGVLLWTLLDAAGWADLPGRKTHLQHVILARGKDGYTVALSITELDPAFEGKQVVVATAEDGKPTPTLELAVPGDRKAGRHVKDLTSIEVR